MCGIVGLFSPGDPQRVWDQEKLRAMLAALSHRGPDGQGMHVEPGVFLGHTRLAVLDLSAAGKQPMFSRDYRYIISFNGEIYNFQLLRQELTRRGHDFLTQTDTEVLLAAWVEWGAACLGRLDGIFAFAVFDRKERTLFLVRDHLGVKPLFYWKSSQLLAFASEPLAMFGPVIPLPEVNAGDLDGYFTYNYLPGPGSGLKNLRQLPPGHLLKISPQGERLTRYWQLACPATPLPWNRELVERFGELVQRSVTGQLVSDAPLGLFLSGGLDSTTVALAAWQSGRHPVAYCLGFEQTGFDETPAASAFASHLGLALQGEVFFWSESEIRTTLEAMRELHADASCFPTFQLSRRAQRDCTVILAGDGGDELLAGYDTYKAGELTPWIRRIPEILRKTALAMTPLLPADRQRYSPRMVLERLLASADAGPRRDHASFRRIFSDALKQRLYQPDFWQAVRGKDPVGDYVAKMDEVPAERSYLTARQYADLHHFLPAVLAKVDRMSMANGLEVRVPLLSRELVEFCFQLPDEAKRQGGKGKRIMRDLLVNRVPPGHLQRPKAGFLPPVDGWFRHPGPMFGVFREHLEWARNHGVGWLRWHEVEQVWEEHQQGRLNAGFVLLGILQFINWSGHARGCGLKQNGNFC
ncbi:MAG: asparagine synthase (glutamine-hydrolyzing) [Magnetococcales bacterium]|nr:asparagine synthase (glutamine-hydrolyzing) [Magnetococcales bacterium]